MLNKFHQGWRESRKGKVKQLIGHLSLLQMLKEIIDGAIKDKEDKKKKIIKELDD